MALLAGCTLHRRPSHRYLSALGFAELALEAPLPSRGTLARWRQELPAKTTISVVAPRAAVVSTRGPLRRDPSMDAAIRWWLEAAEALRATTLVLPTPADLAPGARDRQVLRAYLEALPRSADRWLAWHPAGVWTAEETIEEAARSGVVAVVDPLEDDEVPPPPRAYARLGSLGSRDRFTDTMLEQIAETFAGHDLALVAFRSDRAFDEAKRLDGLARSVESA